MNGKKPTCYICDKEITKGHFSAEISIPLYMCDECYKAKHEWDCVEIDMREKTFSLVFPNAIFKKLESTIEKARDAIYCSFRDDEAGRDISQDAYDLTSKIKTLMNEAAK